MMTASDIVQALRVSYGAAWALVEQVGDTTGAYTSRHLDVVAFGLWPSRGLSIHGIEVKVSRQDFLREMSNPSKAEAIASRCDRFFIAAPAGMVDPYTLNRLAPGWGLLEVKREPSRTRVKTMVPAAELTPQAIDRAFVAAVLRQLPVPTEQVRQDIEQAERTRLEAEFDGRVERETERRLGALTGLAARVRAFTETTGIDLAGESEEWRWLSTEHVAAAVKFLAQERGDRWGGLGAQLRSSAQAARREATRLGEVAVGLEQAAGLFLHE